MSGEIIVYGHTACTEFYYCKLRDECGRNQTAIEIARISVTNPDLFDRLMSTAMQAGQVWVKKSEPECRRPDKFWPERSSSVGRTYYIDRSSV